MKSEIRWCVYCGGTTPGTTIDHMPPRAMFDNKQRPQGLEFLACEACNSGSKHDDLVASLLGRMHDGTPEGGNESEIKSLFGAVRNNVPGLFEEMEPSIRQKRSARQLVGYNRDALSPMNAGGPIMNRHMTRFAAKLTLALHFERTGKIAPSNASVCVRWFTNEAILKKTLPTELIALCGDPKTLQQGSKTVAGQFEYASTHTEDGIMSAHYATFRVSFAVAGFLDCRGLRTTDGPVEATFPPGFLKNQFQESSRPYN